MLNDFTGADKICIACGYTDLRRGIDGLASMVQQQFQLSPFTNTLFLFYGRRRDRIKALYREGDGFLLLYKRLESGTRSEAEARLLTPQQYRWLMEGLNVEQPRATNLLRLFWRTQSNFWRDSPVAPCRRLPGLPQFVGKHTGDAAHMSGASLTKH